MPIYQYRCDTCGEQFELTQSVHDDALKRCPGKRSGLGPAGCTSPAKGKVARVFSAPGIAFKGSGFYKTDNRSSSKSSSKSSNGSSDSKSDSSTSTTKESSSSKSESTSSSSSDSS